MTQSKTVCPVTKREFSIELDMPSGPSLAPYGEIVGYTFTLAKCPDCGGIHAWECPDVAHLCGTLANVRSIAVHNSTAGRQTRQSH